MHEPAASHQCEHQPAMGRPLNHVPHIRNPKLRQYYLQGTMFDITSQSASCLHQAEAEWLQDENQF